MKEATGAHSIGVEFGSVYTKAVVLEPDGQVGLSRRWVNAAEGGTALEDFLAEVNRRHPGERFRVGVTGVRVGADQGSRLFVANGILSLAWGAHWLSPRTRNIIEVAGQTSKFLALAPGEGRPVLREFSTNDACAAGTGSFLEQQARRMSLTLDEFSALSAAAPRAATVAGRCAVFAKTDMIHLQQKGTPVGEIAYGFCLAICRNALTTLLKGSEVEAPVLIAGGCAQNQGIVRGFREVLGVEEEALCASPRPGLESALGAALGAQEASVEELPVDALREELTAMGLADEGDALGSLPPLVGSDRWTRREEPTGRFDQPREGYLGVDLGSVSTDFVVLDPEGQLLTAVYLPTRGQPVEVLREGLALLRERFGGGLQVLGCGTTGSGRRLAAKLLGADVVKNEITCQLLGARHCCGDVGTVMEIGGQDSKFLSVRDGEIADFVMNKICAAGTGSFLEEQAGQIGVDLYRDFRSHAFAAQAPRDLGSRCTVFMETEVVNASRAGAAAGDLCAGLAYSLVHNYLEKVVDGRPVAGRVVVQGGVASNDAVLAAFEQALDRPVEVHPYNRLSGAIGAALAAQAATSGATTSRFMGLDPGPLPSLSTFECRRCPNSCEVNVIETGGERAYFGDTCERYTTRASGSAQAVTLPNVAAEYTKRGEAYFPEGDSYRRTVGLPRASTLMAYLPFWGTFFAELGFTPVLSDSSSRDTLTLGLKHLPVSVCLPIKLAAGHVNALLDQGVDYVFAPSTVLLPGDVPERSYACPYAMAVPYMIGTGSRRNLLSPALSLASEQDFVDGFSACRRVLAVSRNQIRTAFRSATSAQTEFDETFRRWTQDCLAEGAHRFLFAVLGKPYTTLDAYLNLNLFERLRRMGVLAVPAKYLPLDPPADQSTLPWRLSADIHNAAMALTGRDDMVPVLLTSFGCGPDAFTLKQVEDVLRSGPHLVLELDEHRAEAGLLTRLEAFLDQLEGATPRRRGSARTETARQESCRSIPEKGAEIRVPYFGDHVFAFTGAWKFAGYTLEVLPPPGQEVRALGEKYALGKECHAYAMLVGDLIKLHQTSGGRELVFYFPGASLPCLLHQYGSGMQILLREQGIENLTVCSPTGHEVLDAFGVEALERFYLGLFAIELVAKAACQIRPYERNRGETDARHRENLRRIEAAIAGGNVFDALAEGLQRLSAIDTDPGPGRPVVGVVGDLYTRANPAANSDLFRWLEDQGVEVWPAPFHLDLLDFGISRQFFRSMSKREFPELLINGSLMVRRAFETWRMRRASAARVSRFEEPGYLEMRRLAAPYMPNEAHDLLFLNVAKTVDFARRGVDGIINAICFNCMVGNASAAILEKIREDYHEIPIITAVYAGSEDPSRRIVLEAFVSQVKEHHQRRSETEP